MSDSSALPDQFEMAIKQLESEFTHLLGHIRRSFIESAERLSPGLLPGSYKVFTMIAANAPITASDVAERMLIDKSHLSRTIKELEERELVQRSPDPSDRRANLLSPTEHGVARLAVARMPTQGLLSEALKGFPIEDVETTARVLRALYARAEDHAH